MKSLPGRLAQVPGWAKRQLYWCQVGIVSPNLMGLKYERRRKPPSISVVVLQYVYKLFDTLPKRMGIEKAVTQ